MRFHGSSGFPLSSVRVPGRSARQGHAELCRTTAEVQLVGSGSIPVVPPTAPHSTTAAPRVLPAELQKQLSHRVTLTGCKKTMGEVSKIMGFRMFHLKVM